MAPEGRSQASVGSQGLSDSMPRHMAGTQEVSAVPLQFGYHGQSRQTKQSSGTPC